VNKEYPIDYFVPLTGDEFLLGRITVNKLMLAKGQAFNVEIDLVQSESRKIWRHIQNLYQIPDEQEALELAMQKLSEFVRNKSSEV
jgi:hypothetical protein